MLSRHLHSPNVNSKNVQREKYSKEKKRLNIKFKAKKEPFIREGHSHGPKQEVRVRQTLRRETRDEKEDMSERGIENSDKKLHWTEGGRQTTGGKGQTL